MHLSSHSPTEVRVAKSTAKSTPLTIHRQDRTLGQILERLNDLSRDNQDMRKAIQELRDAMDGRQQRRTPVEFSGSQVEDIARAGE